MVSAISSAIRLMAIYIFGATGDIIIEKSGHLNMGVPGIMFFGALGGVVGANIYTANLEVFNSFLIVFIPLLFSLLFGAIGGFVFSFFTVTLKCNHNVTGLAMTTFGVGLSRYFISTFKIGNIGAAALQVYHLFPGYENLGPFGEMFLSGSFFTYFSIILAIIVSLVMTKTRLGLNLRAVGENPASADAAGINVNRYRYLATMVGSAIVALGGLTFVFDIDLGAFSPTDTIDAYGWLCLSIVILSAWRSWISILISFAISFLYYLPLKLNPGGTSAALKYLMDAIPYVASIIVLIIASILGSKKLQPPAGLGKTYFREDR